MASKVTIKDNSATWLKVQLINFDNATRAMAEATTTLANVTTPLRTGTLRSSRRARRNSPLNYSAMFGDSRVAYAAYQERGMRADGSHKVRHYTTPGTGAHFLKNAGDTVAKQGIRTYL